MMLFVGSSNPVKINAVKVAANGQWPDVEVRGFEVPSGVAAQPMTDEETRQGAQNRATGALTAGIKAMGGPDLECLGVGLEGGVFELSTGELWSTVWVVVVDQHGQLFESNGARFKVPSEIAQAIKAGKEMGPVVQKLSGIVDVRKLNGMIGIVTKDFTNRTEEYAAIAKLALGLWFGKDWAKII